MNQQQFDMACVQLRQVRSKLMGELTADLDSLRESHRADMRRLEAERCRHIRVLRDTLAELRSNYVPRSGVYVANAIKAKNLCDDGIAEVEEKKEACRTEYFEKRQALRRLIAQTSQDLEKRRAEILEEYEQWLIQRRAEKAQKGGEA